MRPLIGTREDAKFSALRPDDAVPGLLCVFARVHASIPDFLSQNLHISHFESVHHPAVHAPSGRNASLKLSSGRYMLDAHGWHLQLFDRAKSATYFRSRQVISGVGV